MINASGRRLTEPPGDDAVDRVPKQALHGAQSEDQAAHGPEAAQRQFEADEEQQKDDAHVGQHGDLLLAGDGMNHSSTGSPAASSSLFKFRADECRTHGQKAEDGLIFSLCITGTMTPAVPRMSNASLKMPMSFEGDMPDHRPRSAICAHSVPEETDGLK